LRFADRLLAPPPPEIEIALTTRLLNDNAIGIVGAIAAAIGIQAALNHDVVPASLLAMAAVVALLRIIMVRRTHLRFGRQAPDLAVARRRQLGYAVGSAATSILFGSASLSVLSSRDPVLALLVVCGLCCYVFSLILRTAVRPLVCLSSIICALVPTFYGFTYFLRGSGYLTPQFAFVALATAAGVLLISCIELTFHVYESTCHQLAAEGELKQFARRDPLTGLNNRLALEERFERISQDPTRSIALLYLDLDGFKPVNDAHGHQAGDALLAEVASRLDVCARSHSEAFRIGGDEFVVLMTPPARRADAVRVAERILDILSEPYGIAATTIRLSASIGIALVERTCTDLESLMAEADAALYLAKRSGRGTFRISAGGGPR
jgi:diguanylate cyclase (GGDEF)-like protein